MAGSLDAQQPNAATPGSTAPGTPNLDSVMPHLSASPDSSAAQFPDHQDLSQLTHPKYVQGQLAFMEDPGVPLLTPAEQRAVLEELVANFNLKGLDLDAFGLRPLQYAAALQLLSSDAPSSILKAGTGSGKTGIFLMKALEEKAKGNCSGLIIPFLSIDSQAKLILERFTEKGWLSIETCTGKSNQTLRMRRYLNEPDITIISRLVLEQDMRFINWDRMRFVAFDEPQAMQRKDGSIREAEALAEAHPEVTQVFMSATPSTSTEKLIVMRHSVKATRMFEVKTPKADNPTATTERNVLQEIYEIPVANYLKPLVHALREEAVRTFNMVRPDFRQTLAFEVPQITNLRVPSFAERQTIATIAAHRLAPRLEADRKAKEKEAQETAAQNGPEENTRVTIEVSSSEPGNIDDYSIQPDEIDAGTAEDSETEETDLGSATETSISAECNKLTSMFNRAYLLGGFAGLEKFFYPYAQRFIQSDPDSKYTGLYLPELEGTPKKLDRRGVLTLADKRISGNKTVLPQIEAIAKGTPYELLLHLDNWEDILHHAKVYFDPIDEDKPTTSTLHRRQILDGMNKRLRAPGGRTEMARAFFDKSLQFMAHRELSDSLKLAATSELLERHLDILATGRSFVFTTMTRHAEFLSEAIDYRYGESGMKPIALHGKLPKKMQDAGMDMLRSGERNILFTNVQWAGTGVDLPAARMGIFFSVTDSSPTKLIQGLGRIVGRADLMALIFFLTTEGSPEKRWIERAFERAKELDAGFSARAEAIYPLFRTK